MTELKRSILSLVAKIPKGKMVAYGDVGNFLGISARTIGFIMTGLTSSESEIYPWHRVVNKQGFISSSKLGTRGQIQESLLKAEGLEISGFQIIDPSRYWFKF